MINDALIDVKWTERNGLSNLRESLDKGYDPLESTRIAIDSWIKSDTWWDGQGSGIDELMSEYLTLGDFDRAEQEILVAPEQERYRMIGNLESARGHFASADAFYGLAVDDRNWRAYVDFANSLMDRDGVDLSAVRLLLDRAVEHGDVLAWASLSRSYWLEGDDEKSMTVAMQGVDKGSIGALVRYAYALYGLECVNGAMAASLDALRLGAHESLFTLCCSLKSLGAIELLSDLLATVSGRINPILERNILSEIE